MSPFFASLCETCGHCRTVVSGTGSRFLLCRLSTTDAKQHGRRYAKYPPQPTVRCAGYEPRTAAADATNDAPSQTE